jgi:hypothetical protein
MRKDVNRSWREKNFEQEFKQGFEEEFFIAGDRVGRTDDKRMQWLLKFAQVDLRKLSLGDRCNLQMDIVAFRNPFEVHHHEVPRLDTYETVIELEKLPIVQAQVQSWLNDLAAHKSISFEFPSAIRYLYVTNVGNECHVSESLTVEPEQKFGWIVFDLLKSTADKLTFCASSECKNRLFLADRGNKKYCSTKCQVREAVRSYRKAKDPNYIPGRKRGRPRKERTASALRKVKK